MRRWGPALAAVSVLGVVVAIGAAGKSNSGAATNAGAPIDTQVDDVAVTDSVEPGATDVATIDSTPVVETVPPPSTTTIAKVPIRRTLMKGSRSKDVKRVQQRLIDLGYDPGKVTGYFNEATRAAVWAFEKLVMRRPATEVTGKVTAEVWDRMQDNLVVVPKRPKGTSTHLEVYLPEQVAILFVKNKARLITHISSGTGKYWEETVSIDPGEDGNPTNEPIQAIVKGFSVTPGGMYKFYRRYVDPATGGWREGRLGKMYKPVYFNKGLAVHGASSVPSYPASHGCVRIPMHIADYFPDLVKNGDQVFVFDGKHSPEYYGKQPPKADSVVRITTTTIAGATTTVRRSSTTTTLEPTTTLP